MDQKCIKRSGRTVRRFGKRLGWEIHECKHARTVMREAMKKSEFLKKDGKKSKLRIRHGAIWGVGKQDRKRIKKQIKRNAISSDNKRTFRDIWGSQKQLLKEENTARKKKLISQVKFNYNEEIMNKSNSVKSQYQCCQKKHYVSNGVTYWKYELSFLKFKKHQDGPNCIHKVNNIAVGNAVSKMFLINITSKIYIVVINSYKHFTIYILHISHIIVLLFRSSKDFTFHNTGKSVLPHYTSQTKKNHKAIHQFNLKSRKKAV